MLRQKVKSHDFIFVPTIGQRNSTAASFHPVNCESVKPRFPGIFVLVYKSALLEPLRGNFLVLAATGD